jgi:hypothetical protein
LNARYEEMRIWFSDFLISGLPGLDYGSHLDYRDRRKIQDQGGGRGMRGSMCCGFGENEVGISVSLVFILRNAYEAKTMNFCCWSMRAEVCKLQVRGTIISKFVEKFLCLDEGSDILVLWYCEKKKDFLTWIDAKQA